MALLKDDRKNYIMNAGFDFWQRSIGIAGTSALAGNFETYFGPDRFSVVRGGSANANDAFIRSADTPNNDFKYSLSITRGITLGTDQLYLNQKIESSEIRHLAGKQASFSFWAKANANVDIFEVNLVYPNAEDTWPGETGFHYQDLSGELSAGTWKLYTVENITLDANVINGLAVRINARNSSGSGDATVLFAGLMLNEGATVAPFKRVGDTLSQELLMCLRYYEKSHDSDPGRRPDIYDVNNIINNGDIYASTRYRVGKRRTPTLTLADGIGDNSNQVSSLSVTYGANSGTIGENNKDLFALLNASGGALDMVTSTGRSLAYFYWESDAEL